MRIVANIMIIILVPVCGLSQTVSDARQKTRSRTTAESITIGVKELAPQKEPILTEARQLTETSSTAQVSAAYVRRYQAFSAMVAKANMSDWSDEEKSIVSNVPKPSEEAQKLFADDQKETERRLRERSEDFDRRLAITTERKKQDEKLTAEQQAEEARKRQKHDYNRVFNGLFNYEIDTNRY